MIAEILMEVFLVQFFKMSPDVGDRSDFLQDYPTFVSKLHKILLQL